MFKAKAISIILIIILAVTIPIVINIMQLPTVSTSSEALLNYTQQSEFSYKVNLKPNQLYDETSIRSDVGGMYFKNITDNIGINFKYRFLSDEPTDVSGTLKLTPTLIADYSEGKTLWKKELDLTENSIVNFQGTEVEVNFPLKLDFVYDLIKNIEQEIRVYPQDYRLTIAAYTQIAGQPTSEAQIGKIEETQESFMNVYLGDSIIEVDSELIHEKPGVIERLNTTNFPMANTYKLISLSFLGSLIAVTIPPLYVYTKKRNQNKGTDVLVRDILKRYEEVIVKIEQNTALLEKPVTSVSSIEDLVKISEQILKPVIYVDASLETNQNNTHLFYVQDTEMRYEFRI